MRSRSPQPCVSRRTVRHILRHTHTCVLYKVMTTADRLVVAGGRRAPLNLFVGIALFWCTPPRAMRVKRTPDPFTIMPLLLVTVVIQPSAAQLGPSTLRALSSLPLANASGSGLQPWADSACPVGTTHAVVAAGEAVAAGEVAAAGEATAVGVSCPP